LLEVLEADDGALYRRLVDAGRDADDDVAWECLHLILEDAVEELRAGPSLSLRRPGSGRQVITRQVDFTPSAPAVCPSLGLPAFSARSGVYPAIWTSVPGKRSGIGRPPRPVCTTLKLTNAIRALARILRQRWIGTAFESRCRVSRQHRCYGARYYRRP
jgi:hypothetical protein